MKASATAYALFSRWLDLDASARTALLDDLRDQDPQAYRDLLILIEADRGADRLGFLHERALDHARDAAPPGAANAALADRRIGNWRLQRPLGAGGMGQVWLARRDDGLHGGLAAIKLLHGTGGDDYARQRFAREGGILARLVHRHIAMLLDVGVADSGEHYLVLEYVEGRRIDEFCDEGRLDIAARLRLLVQVCEAVAHAHAHLVVHRDLKPSNILVQGDGNAKLLDFGIAKLLHADAQSDPAREETSNALTPAYAAPEQLLGNPITTATDVHALGMVAFRLLCGASPYGDDAGHAAQIARRIVESEPARMSSCVSGAAAQTVAQCRRTSPERLRRRLQGDLDTIVATAIKQRPDERYASVSALADDIRRHLAHRPIHARPDSRWYRLRKYVRRHLVGVAAAAAIALAVVASAVVLMRSNAAIAREARATAAVKDFLFGLFASVDPTTAKGRTISARELLDRGRKNLDSVASDPALHAELGTVLGRIYGQLGLFDSARELEQAAIAELQAHAAPTLQAASAQLDLGNTLRELGELDAATRVAEEARAKIAAAPDADVADRVRAITLLGKIDIDRRDFTAAKRNAEAAVALARSMPNGTQRLGDSLATLGNAQWGLREFAPAEASLRESMRLYAAESGNDSPMMGRLHSSLALALNGQSRYADALEENRRALDILETTLGAGHKAVLGTRGAIGLSQYHLGRYRDALATLQAVADARRAQAGADDPTLAGILINLGQTQIEIPDLAGAEASYAESLGIFEKKYGRDYQGARLALSGLGSVHVLQGRGETAIAELEEVRRLDRAHGERDNQSNTYWLGEAYLRRHDIAHAIELDREALASALRVGGERSRHTASAHYYLGRALHDSGDAAGAEREMRASLSSFEYIPGADHPKAATVRLELAQMLLARADAREEAIALLRDATAIREKFLGADDVRTQQARALLAQTRSNG